MIVTEDKLIFIDNPKCASTTMRAYYEQILPKIVFRSSRTIGQCNGDHADPNYVHSNLGGAINYLKSTNQKVSDFKIFTTIRNPYERFYSHYRYFVKMNENKLSKDELKVDNFLYRKMTVCCFPRNFRFYEDHEVENLIKVENIHGDLEKFNNIHNIGFKISSSMKKNTSNNTVRGFKFTDEIIKYIDLNYSDDFSSGKYKHETSKELNERLGLSWKAERDTK